MEDTGLLTDRSVHRGHELLRGDLLQEDLVEVGQHGVTDLGQGGRQGSTRVLRRHGARVGEHRVGLGDLAKRELMESAGRKEIAMMVPLVFGVLPLTVLFAVYPGIALINLGF